MKTYYDLLNVETSSSPEEIKRAFRRRAKELHPDTSPYGIASVDHMRGLLRAYETLIDPIRREEYDRTHFIVAEEYRFDYRTFLKKHPEDERLQSKLVFHDLLHHMEEEAVQVYEGLRGAGLAMQEHLGREDYMDCLFLLAEEYERRLAYVKAFDLLLIVVDLEIEKPYFRHFFVEVTEKLRTIVCFKMPATMSSSEVIDCIEELLVRDLHYKDIAFYLKKAAELYVELGDDVTAAAYLQRGIEIDQKLGGTKKLREHLEAFHVERPRVM